MEQDEIAQIRKFVSGKAEFDNIYLVQASPAISANCGPKTFGFFYKEDRYQITYRRGVIGENRID